MRSIVGIFLLLTLSACSLTSNELENTSTALSPNVTAILREQTLENLGRFIGNCSVNQLNAPNGGLSAVNQPNDPSQLTLALSNSISCDAIPSQFVLGSGQAQVSNSLGFPNQTTLNIQGIFLKALGIQNTNQWVQTWSISPVTDYGDLKRLTLLYGYAVLLTAEDYTDYEQTSGPPHQLGSLSVADTDPLVQNFANSWLYVPINSSGSQNDTVPIYKAAGSSTGGFPAYLTLPMPLPPILNYPTSGHPPNMSNYVWCMTDKVGNSWCNASVNPEQWPTRLPDAPFVFWGNAHPNDATYAGVYNGHTLYIREAQFQDFLRWVLGATVDTAAGGGGGGGKSGAGVLLTPPTTP